MCIDFIAEDKRCIIVQAGGYTKHDGKIKRSVELEYKNVTKEAARLGFAKMMVGSV